MRATPALLFLFVSFAAAAHQDRIIGIGEGGKLTGIPSQFGPAELRVTFAAGTAAKAPIEHVELKLGNSVAVLSPCLTAMLKSPSIANVFVTASWYHDEEVLPYYVQVTFYDPGYDRDNFANSGFSFLFDLRTATLIELNQLIVEDSGKALQYVRLDPKQACGSEP